MGCASRCHFGWVRSEFSCEARVVPEVKVSAVHGLEHGVGMQSFEPLTVYCRVYEQLRGEVVFSFPGPHVCLCPCAVLLVHGA